MDILTTLKQRLADAEGDAERLREAIRILEANGHEPAPPKPAPATVVPLGKLLKWVGDHPGTTTTTIAKQTGGDQAAVLALLKEAEQAGKVRREGERRATAWHLVKR